jgi:hypothetical protein
LICGDREELSELVKAIAAPYAASSLLPFAAPVSQLQGRLQKKPALHQPLPTDHVHITYLKLYGGNWTVIRAGTSHWTMNWSSLIVWYSEKNSSSEIPTPHSDFSWYFDFDLSFSPFSEGTMSRWLSLLPYFQNIPVPGKIVGWVEHLAKLFEEDDSENTAYQRAEKIFNERA